MRMLIRYENGLSAEGVLLAASQLRMRVAMPDARDTVEFTMLDGAWHEESGRSVQIEGLFAVPGVDYPRASFGVASRRAAAFGSVFES